MMSLVLSSYSIYGHRPFYAKLVIIYCFLGYIVYLPQQPTTASDLLLLVIAVLWMRFSSQTIMELLPLIHFVHFFHWLHHRGKGS